MFRSIVLMSVLTAALTLVVGAAILSPLGCSRDQGTPAAAQATTTKVVNAKCPIRGEAIDPAKVPEDLVRTYKGQKVGFCCAGCPEAWDKLTDAQKDAKLQAAMAKAAP